MVVVREDKKMRKEAKVPFSDIQDDNSKYKERSHDQLKSLVSKLGDAILAQLYKHKELLLLQKGYGIPVRTSHNKACLGKELAKAIQTHACILQPWCLIPPSSVCAFVNKTQTNTRVMAHCMHKGFG